MSEKTSSSSSSSTKPSILVRGCVLSVLHATTRSQRTILFRYRECNAHLNDDIDNDGDELDSDDTKAARVGQKRSASTLTATSSKVTTRHAQLYDTNCILPSSSPLLSFEVTIELLHHSAEEARAGADKLGSLQRPVPALLIHCHSAALRGGVSGRTLTHAHLRAAVRGKSASAARSRILRSRSARSCSALVAHRQHLRQSPRA